MPRLLFLALAVLLVGGCATTAPPAPPATPAERGDLVGRWIMQRIYDGQRDVSILQNPNRDRYIALHADGSFESGGGPYSRNTGQWTYDNATRRLVLDSALGQGDDSAWAVLLRGDLMEWASTGEDAGRFRIVARRAD